MNTDNQPIIEYIYNFAWMYGRYFHLGDSDKIKAAISERFMLPEEWMETKAPYADTSELNRCKEAERETLCARLKAFDQLAHEQHTFLEEAAQFLPLDEYARYKSLSEKYAALCGRETDHVSPNCPLD
jgi:hypothetical protein